MNLLNTRPAETITIAGALTVLLGRLLNGDLELAGAIVTLGVGVIPAIVTAIHVRLKKRRIAG